MRLLRIRAANAFQYPLIDLDLDGSLVAMVGRNGEGKSNLLRLLQYGVTGDVQGVTRDQMLNWDAASHGRTGWVELDFVHELRKYTIKRGIGGSSVWLKTAGVKEALANGASAVAAEMGRMFDIDKDVGRAAFVPQGELESVLFAGTAERERGFQRLCGLAGAAQIHQGLGRFISTRFSDPPDYPGQLARAEQALASLQLSLDSATSALAGMQAPDTAGGDAQALRRATAVHTFATAMSTYQSADVALRAAQPSVDEAVALASAAKAAAEAVDIAGIRSSLHQVDAAISQNTAFQEAVSAAQAARSYKQQLDAGPAAQLAALEATIAQLSEQRDALYQVNNQLSGQLQLLQPFSAALDKFVRASGTVLACPVCSHPVDDPTALAERLRAQIARVSGGIEADKAAAVARQVVTATADKRRIDAELATASTRLAAAEARLAGMGAPERSLDDLRTLRADLQSAVTAHTRLMAEETATHRTMLSRQQEAASFATRRSAAGSAAAAALAGMDTEELKTLATQNTPPFAAGPADQAVVDACTARLHAHASAMETSTQAWMSHMRAFADATARKEGLERDVARTREEIRQIQEQAARWETSRAARASVERIRAWFNYTEGPAHLTARLLQAIVADTNQYLAELQAPYRIKQAGGTLEFRAMFLDGRAQPDGGAPLASLSGGQRVAAAFAFRLATYQSFAAKLGVMSLDEPTQFLDEEAVQRFCELLDQLKVTARRLDLQLFMATHERAAIPFMDRVIDVTSLKVAKPEVTPTTA